MTLHLINKSPANSSALEDCIAVLQAKTGANAIILIEDAVYLADNSVKNTELYRKISTLALPCYILKEDLTVRGLNSAPADCFTVVDYAGFVQLTLDYDKVQNWS